MIIIIIIIIIIVIIIITMMMMMVIIIIIVRGALIYAVVPIIITFLGVHPIFKARTTAFLIFLLFQVDSFVAGASKTQEDI